MSDPQVIQLLTEIREQIKANNTVLTDIKEDLRTDRSMVWKVLLLTIAGAFAVIGVRMALP